MKTKKIDKSCPHCGPQSVESVEYRFYNCPLALQGWRYVANVMWQFFAKRGNLGARKSFCMMQCLFDQPLCKTLRWFIQIWFFLRSNISWITWRQRNDLVFNDLQWPVEKTRQVMWDVLQDYGRIECKRTLSDLEDAPAVAYQDFLNKFDSTLGVKGLIMTHSNLVVTWKVDPNGHYFLISLQLALDLPWGGCILVPSLQLTLQFVPPKRRKQLGSAWLGLVSG